MIPSSGFWIAFCIFYLCINQAIGMSQIDATFLQDWAFNFTRNSGWDIADDPCNWAGVTCGSNSSGTYKEVQATFFSYGIIGEFIGLDLDITLTFHHIYGEFPDLDLWAAAKAQGLAFRSLRFLNFRRFKFGPAFPDSINKYWSNYNDSHPRQPFNVYLSAPLRPDNFSFANAAPSAICPLPDPFMTAMGQEKRTTPGRSETGCSNVYITSMEPIIGPREGGTNVTIYLNVPLGYLDIKVGFGYYLTDNITQPVPITSHIIFQYPWEDYKSSWVGSIDFSLTLIKCVTPPHPPGPVVVSVWAGSNRVAYAPPPLVASPALNPPTLVTPRVRWADPYEFVFSYECPAGTKQSEDAYGNIICETCPPGMWSHIYSSVCYNCSYGTYASSSGSSTCTECPKGTYLDIMGASSAKSCIPCPEGHYSTETGSDSCVACSPGEFQADTGQQSCDRCKPGEYSVGYGNQNCTSCPAGTYSTAVGSTKCDLCAIGLISGAGAISCLSCPPGKSTLELGSSTCDYDCPMGYYKPTGSTRCIECSPGRFSNQTSSVICQPCDIDEYNPDPNATFCLKCIPPEFTSYKGATSCSKPTGKSTPQNENNTGFIIGIVLLVVAIVLVTIGIIYVVIKKRAQNEKQKEIDEIRMIMEDLGKEDD